MTTLWTQAQAHLRTSRVALITIGLAILFVWLALNWLHAVRLILEWYTPLPAWDYWRVPLDLSTYKSLGFGVFLKQHNEHRIIFPEFVFVLDMLLWHGRLILPIAVSFLCYAGVWILVGAAIFVDKALSLSLRWAAILLAGIVIGWKGSALVLASPFLLTWTLTQFAVAIALTCLLRAADKHGNTYLGGAIFAAVIATYSLANGLLLWPILLAAALLLKLSRRQLFALVISGILSIGLYFVSYSSPNHLNIGNFFLHPIYSLGFIGAYLNGPFAGSSGPYIGLITLAIVIALAFLASRRALILSRPGIVLFGLYSFALLTALLTAAGRMDPHDPAFTTARQFRYLTVPLVNWAVFVLLCVWMASRLGSKPTIAAPLIVFVFAALVYHEFHKLRGWPEGLGDQFADTEATALSLEDGITDRLLLRKIFPHPELVMLLSKYLRQNHMSVFSGNRAKWLGRPAAKFAVPVSRTAIGQISSVFPVQGGFEVAGWADDSGEPHPAEWVMLVNDKDQVAGFGRKLPAGLPRYLRSPDLPYSLGWVGFVNLKFQSESYSAYLIEKAGLLPFGKPFSAPSVQAVGQDQVGPVIQGVEWSKDPAWTLHGDAPLAHFGILPLGRIYGSWSGADANTGKIASSVFAAPASGCLILPVLTSSDVSGQSVEILNPDTGQVLEHVPMQNGEMLWAFWRFALPPAVKHLQVVAEDRGKEWSQWLAISDPAQCP